MNKQFKTWIKSNDINVVKEFNCNDNIEYQLDKDLTNKQLNEVKRLFPLDFYIESRKDVEPFISINN